MGTVARWRCLTCDADGIGGMIDCNETAKRHAEEQGHQTITTVAHGVNEPQPVLSEP